MRGVHAYRPVATDDEAKVQEVARKSALGAAKLCRALRLDDTTNVETNSVYGSAMVMPQLARSAGWPVNLAMAALRSYLYLTINVVCQVYFLFMLNKEEEIMDAFAGQMYLCDLGASLDKCPDAPGCMGPGGTLFAAPRIYPFDQWTTRNFVRDSLKAIFPEKKAEIERFADPGEYGLESYKCRLLCCVLFMVSLTSEFDTITKLCHLLYSLPTNHDMWFEYDPEVDSEVTVKIAGMPRHWKIMNILFILFPKIFLWKLTCQAGINFLLDTAGIVDVIANSVALGFILSIDELLFENLTAQDTKDLMGMIQGFDVNAADTNTVDLPNDEDSLLKERRDSQNRCSFKAVLPIKLFLVIALTIPFVGNYYLEHCHKNVEGEWVPNPLFWPKSVDYNILEYFFPHIFPRESGEEAVWTMPLVDGHDD